MFELICSSLYLLRIIDDFLQRTKTAQTEAAVFLHALLF